MSSAFGPLSLTTPSAPRPGGVADAPFVRVERAHFLGDPARQRLLGDEARHLPQLGVLVLPEAVAVDDDAIVVAELLAKSRGDNVLQCLQAFAAAAHEHAAV